MRDFTQRLAAAEAAAAAAATKETNRPQWNLDALNLAELREYRALLVKARNGEVYDWDLLDDQQVIRLNNLRQKMGQTKRSLGNAQPITTRSKETAESENENGNN